MVNTTEGAQERRPQPLVTVTIHIPLETLELLRDVALARVVANVAAESHGTHVDARRRDPDISAIITDVVERHRALLEHEAGQLRGAGKI